MDPDEYRSIVGRITSPDDYRALLDRLPYRDAVRVAGTDVQLGLDLAIRAGNPLALTMPGDVLALARVMETASVAARFMMRVAKFHKINDDVKASERAAGLFDGLARTLRECLSVLELRTKPQPKAQS